ncbi:hydroxymethylglutaryl-CoA reductase, degradative [Myxococcota bacterium]|nr:hydroxymethylglutaryl-CoA reductase, degradative [Myxococcota bacterium]
MNLPPDTPLDTRRPGWHRGSPWDRLRDLARSLGESSEELEAVLAQGGLSVEQADRLAENVVGTFSLPFAVAPNFRINGRDLWMPMVTDEPSVVAAASHAARMVREGGGFLADADPPITICQVQVFTADPEAAGQAIRAARREILELARSQDPVLASLGGGPVDLEVRPFPGEGSDPPFVVVHLLVDTRDAMGANAVNRMAEAVASLLASLAGGRPGLRILSNLADRRLVRVRARVPLAALRGEDRSPEEVRDGIVAASRFAARDPYRATTHNKGILNGIDAVAVATGNDWRAVEAGAHAFAASRGTYAPLCTWHREGDDLAGRMELPLAMGTVGGLTDVHPVARISLRILGVRTATELAMAAAAAGMANNLAALRALAAEGIQRGHMRLHRRGRPSPGG